MTCPCPWDAIIFPRRRPWLVWLHTPGGVAAGRNLRGKERAYMCGKRIPQLCFRRCCIFPSSNTRHHRDKQPVYCCTMTLETYFSQSIQTPIERTRAPARVQPPHRGINMLWNSQSASPYAAVPASCSRKGWAANSTLHAFVCCRQREHIH